MGLFHERRETETAVIIRYKNHPLLYLAMGLFFFPLGHSFLSALPVLIGITFIVVFFIDVWKPNAEVRTAMKKGSIKITGSKLSFKNPITVVIDKTK